MNYKTTFVLLVLVVAGGVAFWWAPDLAPRLGLTPTQPTAADAGTLQTVRDELTPEKLERIEVQHGQRLVVLERSAGGEWTLPGRWPARKAEVDDLVHRLTSLQSRFLPIALTAAAELRSYGLDQPLVTVAVRAAQKSYRLAFGEEPGDSNRFSRPTYLRLDERPEVVRLAPGLGAALDRPQDYYQQRRLFPSERVAQDSPIPEKIEQLVAQTIAVHGPTGSFRLEKDGAQWWLQDPLHDLADPEKLKSILRAVPDIWAEQFVQKPKADLAEYGLKEPAQTLRVTRPAGDTTLLIGKQSRMKTRTVTRPAPNMGGPPLPPQREVIHEEYRFAKLQDNEQIFEIQAEKLKDVFVAANSLRDANLARFRSEDARRVEIRQGGQEIILVKEKDKWLLQKPLQADAESGKITELLDKLSGLQARDKDVVDTADTKSYGLDKPTAVIHWTVEEEHKGDGANKTRQTKSFTCTFGKHEIDQAKLYVQVAGRERINAVEDSVLKLVQRPALAYRGRRILDVPSTDLAKIEVRHGTDPFTLEQVQGTWRLVTPVAADVDASQVGQLAGDLSHLEAVEYVAESATPEQLETLYGLGKPSLSATVTFTDAQKPAQTLLLGKQRAGKPEYFAKLQAAGEIFVVKNEVHDALGHDSLSYRPLQLWQIPADEIQEVRIAKKEPEYQLRHEGQGWKITGPFEATAAANVARPLLEELAHLRCERYVAHTAKDLAAYGLDKPYLRLTLPGAPKEKDPKEEVKERVLLIGNPTANDAKARFAKLGASPAIFVVGEKALTAVDHGALDLLARNLLALTPDTIERMQSKGLTGPLTLQRKGQEWHVTEAAVAPFPADRETVQALLGVWSNLRAVRFAAYGPNVNLADYGLDEPAASITVTPKPPAETETNAKAVAHTLILGKVVEGTAGERFARLDAGPAVFVLAADTVRELTHGYLDFVNRTVLQLDAGSIRALQRQMGKETLEITKQANGWQMITPDNVPADAQTLSELLPQLATLRAQRVAAYPAKELQTFQLDNPAATWAIRAARAQGDSEERLLKIGKVVDGADEVGDRFAVVGSASTVFVLPGAFARRLLAAPLQFRDHTLAHFQEADHVTLERDRRKAVFAKVSGSWKLIEPVEAEAEQTELEDFLSAVSRLRAEELVAEKPADLKPYGLDRPELRWRFQAGDKEVLNLLIGGREMPKGGGKEKDGSHRYAKLAGGDLLVLLSPQMTAKVEGEYRSRTLWPPLDAAQVDQLSYGYPDKPFVLEKADNDWHVAGKPAAKVNAEAVRETLDALAGLKAARYVVDKDAELRLYGLEPPQVILEITTRTGKRVLQIGRPEGESKRYYARVPEGGNTSVFTLAEKDAARILRLLPSFVHEGQRPFGMSP